MTNKNEKYIEDLPCVPLFDWKYMGNIPAIYFILDDLKCCYYVGQSKSLRNRFNNYANAGNSRDKWEKFQKVGATQVAWWHCPDPENLDRHENEWIQLLNPPLNKKLNNLNRVSHSLRKPIHNEQILLDYLRLRAELRKAQLQSDAIKKEVILYIQTYGMQNQIHTSLGKIRVGYNYDWQFSKTVEELEEKLKQMKQWEKLNGVAKKLDTYLKVYAYPEDFLLEN